MSTLSRVKKILKEQLGVEEDEIQMSSTFVDDLGADSLDIVELIMAFEEEFNIEIPDEKAEKIRTVGDVVKYIDGETKGGSYKCQRLSRSKKSSKSNLESKRTKFK